MGKPRCASFGAIDAPGDVAANADARMDDLKTLGVRVIRIEIERTTPMTTYTKIIDQQQADDVGYVLRTLRAHARVTASFVYAYRDDEAPNGGEQCDMRANAAAGYAAHAAYATYKVAQSK